MSTVSVVGEDMVREVTGAPTGVWVVCPGADSTSASYQLYDLGQFALCLCASVSPPENADNKSISNRVLIASFKEFKTAWHLGASR